MILEEISAWITDAGGEALTEYQTNEIDENTIECWIPSSEGTNFQIRWKAEKDDQPTHAIRTTPYLDGVRCGAVIARTEKVAKGATGTLRGHPGENSMLRLYCFGKRKLTDDEDIAPLSCEAQEDLNTIKVVFQWGHAGRRLSQARYLTVPDTKPLHEKMAKKGHSGSAELGELTQGERKNWAKFKADPSFQPLTFVFRYASQDWLQAREIAPCSQQPRSSSSPEPGRTNKRPRSATPDVIDIDDLGTDDDEIIVVKHLVSPAPVIPNKKPRKAKDEDVKPKLEL
ncbi:hypothetical protein BDV93DRAFT_526234 [Ceratobasidium sp. AG-I]|nr:hypothetical protein BDV93DRAFT_526234 [Ceratobasidium sp. AG-I]